MADGLQPLLMVPGRTNANNALIVTADTGATTGAKSAVGALVGKAGAAASDGKAALLVVFE